MVTDHSYFFMQSYKQKIGNIGRRIIARLAPLAWSLGRQAVEDSKVDCLSHWLGGGEPPGPFHKG